jgi:hypothetical protein
VHIEVIVAGALLPDAEGPVLEPEPEHTRGARPSVDPQHEGDRSWESCILKEPIEQVVLVLCCLDWEGARIHAREGIRGVPEGEGGN